MPVRRSANSQDIAVCFFNAVLLIQEFRVEYLPLQLFGWSLLQHIPHNQLLTHRFYVLQGLLEPSPEAMCQEEGKVLGVSLSLNEARFLENSFETCALLSFEEKAASSKASVTR